MSEHILRIGVIGVGFYAAGSLIPGLRATGKAEIVAITRRSPDRLRLAQRELNVSEAYIDWRELLEKSSLDAVVVCTPPDTHAEPTVAALDRGLHVFVEKPVALTHGEAQRMIQAQARAGRVLMVGYNTRGMGSWRTIKRLLDEHAIGTLRQVTAAAYIDARILWQEMPLSADLRNWFASSELQNALGSDVLSRGNWRTIPEIIGGGMFADTGSHLQDVMLWLGNGAPAQVVAFAQSVASPSILSALARLDNGVLLSIAFNDAVAGGDEFKFHGSGRITFYGDRGQITADFSGFMAAETDQIWIEQAGVRTKVEPEFETVHPVAAFVDTVLEGAPNLCPATEAARAVALTEAVYQSVAEGRIVHLDSSRMTKST